MRGLEKEYEGRLTVMIGEAQSEEGLAAKKTYGWDQNLHGLVVLDGDGEAVGDLEGHNYGADEIREKIEAALAN